MLGGWYCRSMATAPSSVQQDEEADSMTDESLERPAHGLGIADSPSGTINKPVDYRARYRYLKKKLKFLIFENEFFQDALRSNQRRLLKVSKDRAFLLDRLLQYEKPASSSDSDETESSEDESKLNRKKTSNNASNNNQAPANGATRGRKKKVQAPTEGGTLQLSTTLTADNISLSMTDNATDIAMAAIKQQQQALSIAAADFMSSVSEDQQLANASAAEAVERLLLSKSTSVLDLMPERAPATVPVEMFSNEPSLDSENNAGDGFHSPSHQVAAEECVPMEYSN